MPVIRETKLICERCGPVLRLNQINVTIGVYQDDGDYDDGLERQLVSADLCIKCSSDLKEMVEHFVSKGGERCR